MAFELIFAFDEAISLGHKENVTVAQVKQYCEMESHEERLHKLVMQSKINETKDVMKRRASEIDKSKIEKNRGDRGGFMSSMSGPRKLDSGFSDMSISSSGTGFGSGSGFGLSTDMDSFSSKPKGRPPASATAPPKGLGMKLGKMQRTNQFLESLKAEGEVILEDVQSSAVQSKAPLPLTDPITLTIEERLNDLNLPANSPQYSIFLGSFYDKKYKSEPIYLASALQADICWTIKRCTKIIESVDSSCLGSQVAVQKKIENQDIPGLSFKTHPNINKELFNSQHIIGLKDPNRPFPTGQNDVGLMKWRIQGMDEASLPLTVNCWPSVSGNETFVNIEYEASEMFDLRNVVISIPLPALREQPSVRQIDGEWRYDPRASTLEWSIVLIDQSNRSGSMEFVVPPADPSVFFPINIRFTAANTFSDVKVLLFSHDADDEAVHNWRNGLWERKTRREIRKKFDFCSHPSEGENWKEFDSYRNPLNEGSERSSTPGGHPTEEEVWKEFDFRRHPTEEEVWEKSSSHRHPFEGEIWKKFGSLRKKSERSSALIGICLKERSGRSSASVDIRLKERYGRSSALEGTELKKKSERSSTVGGV
ncbi:hypothetical protein COCNU_scaffold008549G000060 [Cocos nucifera]|nr:hypothetical protein [Cocos nucifera]